MKGNKTHVLYRFGGGGTDRGPSASKCQSQVIGEDKGIEGGRGQEWSGLTRCGKTLTVVWTWKKKSERKHANVCEVRTQHVTTRDQHHKLFNLKKHTGTNLDATRPATVQRPQSW